MAQLSNPPAFPTFEQQRLYRDEADRNGRLDFVPVGGMTLRDYFSGQALTRFGAEYCADNDVTYDDIAERCYRIADAMLTARSRPTEGIE